MRVIGGKTLFTLNEAAEQIGVTERTLRRWHYQEGWGVAYTRLGRRIYILEDELARFVEAQTASGQRELDKIGSKA